MNKQTKINYKKNYFFMRSECYHKKKKNKTNINIKKIKIYSSRTFPYDYLVTT